MISEKKINELVLTSLAADAYCLGSHWVYEESELLNNSLDWNNLNSPLSEYHEGKKIGGDKVKKIVQYGRSTFYCPKLQNNK